MINIRAKIAVAALCMGASISQAYTMQDYYTADADVEAKLNAWESAMASAEPGIFIARWDNAYWEWRRASDNCSQSNSVGAQEDCINQVTDEYYAKGQEIESSQAQALSDAASAETEYQIAVGKQSAIHDDLVAQGLLSP